MGKRERTEWMRVYMNDRRRTMKARAVAYKGGKCEECGYSKCIQAMEFHHPDPQAKDFHISDSAYGWARIRREIDKCQLLCCRCHREVHAEWDAKLIAETKTKRLRDLNTLREARESRRLATSLPEVDRAPTGEANWPSDEDLRRLLDAYPVAVIARNIGVSDVTVLKRARKRGIPTKPPGFWSKVRACKIVTPGSIPG